jgi:hypothetical protein
MSLVQKISDLATAVGAEVKSRITAYHPGVAKAWVCFGYVGEQMVVRAAYNVQSVIRLEAGKYRMNFIRAMPDAKYAWHAFARQGGSQASLQFPAARPTAEAKTADYLEVICVTASGTLSDTPEMNLMVLR